MLTAVERLAAPGLRQRLLELARLGGAPTVTVYLNTHWSDEHQRDRVRAFLKQELRRARAATRDAGLLDDLAWIEAEGERVIRQSRFPDAHGVALFASTPLHLREVLPAGVSFEDALSIGERPVLTPLTEVLADSPATLVVFVDGTSARLIPLDAIGRGEEVTLEHAVERRHRRGGWALLAQSRYHRQIEQQRARHFQAVAAAVTALVREHAIERIVFAGESRAVGLCRAHLPAPIAARVAGTIHGARHEPGAVLTERARALRADLDRAEDARIVEAVITEAAKNGRAVVGVRPTLEAVGRGAVQRLYLLKDLAHVGGACGACATLVAEPGAPCPRCGEATRPVGLGDALVERVLAAGGDVQLMPLHAELESLGGVAARLRYPLTSR
ncbi:MAG: hypothetical protein HYU51_00675 [Candidatus Rokubacteria bacterium]|nr:hypothetical protein [Candidatus Rokubacteria bacterium]